MVAVSRSAIDLLPGIGIILDIYDNVLIYPSSFLELIV